MISLLAKLKEKQLKEEAPSGVVLDKVRPILYGTKDKPTLVIDQPKPFSTHRYSFNVKFTYSYAYIQKAVSLVRTCPEVHETHIKAYLGLALPPPMGLRKPSVINKMNFDTYRKVAKAKLNLTGAQALALPDLLMLADSTDDVSIHNLVAFVHMSLASTTSQFFMEQIFREDPELKSSFNSMLVQCRPAYKVFLESVLPKWVWRLLV